MLCKYAVKAQAQTADGRPLHILLCAYAEAHPERFINLPRWLQAGALAGKPISPHHDCLACSCYKAGQEPWKLLGV